MKITIIILFFLLELIQQSQAYYDIDVPVAGKTIADEALQTDVIKELYKILGHEFPICSDYSVKDTQIISYPRNLKKIKKKYVSGNWEELWTINVCNSPKQVPVSFYITPLETNYYINKSLLPD